MTDAAAELRPASMLTPVQRRTLDALRREGEPIVFDPRFVAELREDAVVAVAELTERLGDRPMRVTKHAIASVLDCEVHFVDPEPFEWSPMLACGKTAHRAIQLLISWRGEPTPADLVDDAIERISDEDTGIGTWIAGLSSADRADLHGRCVERVTQFVECFPPLSRTWHPMTEASVQWPRDGPIVLTARVDLVIGRPHPSESRKVLIDLKSGRPALRHREELRFYALVETLAREVPPRSVATFSLAAGEASVEAVTEASLRSALRRTLDAVSRMIELTEEGRPPAPTPSPNCFDCRRAASCP